MKVFAALVVGLAFLAALLGQAPAREEIRRPDNRLLGVIQQRADGGLEARDPSNRVVGTYHKRDNRTRLPDNRVFTIGNSLAALLVCPRAKQEIRADCGECGAPR